MDKKPELMAPAGDWDSLVAAVQNGADAVYLGGKHFNARSSAANFSEDELEKAVYYAHLRNVNVYVVVNILVSDREMEECLRFLYFLYNIGVDAVIVQDLGLIRHARKVLPGLELHASTQMTAHNYPTVETLKSLGVTRVVLARELSLKEIRSLASKTRLGIEVFIHGALCVCYSGQCLFSSMVGGRSGNRGRCAQPCRLNYTLIDAAGRELSGKQGNKDYLLSTKDLNLSSYIPDLISAGVDAFKIEGRLKSPEYVAAVVRVYRSLIDRALGGDFHVTAEEQANLAQVFNRGFTSGYLLGNPGRDLMSYSRPNNRGVMLGRVKKYDPAAGLAEIELEAGVSTGDRIEIWVTKGGRIECVVDSMKRQDKEVVSADAGSTVLIPVGGKPRPGDRVFKVVDSALNESARRSFTSSKERIEIPVVFHVIAKIGEPLIVKVSDEDGNEGLAKTKALGQQAEKHPLTYEFLEKQLNRLGNTPFVIKSIEFDLQEQVMIPLSEINEARRKAVEGLSRARVIKAGNNYLSEKVFNGRLETSLTGDRIKPAAFPQKALLSISVADLPSLKAAAKSGADIIYFGGEFFKSKRTNYNLSKTIKDGIEYCCQHGVKLILSSPRILRDNDLEEFNLMLDRAKELGIKGVLAGNLGVVSAAVQKGFPVFTDFSLNVFNLSSTKYQQDLGIEQVTLSPELTLKQLRELVPYAGVKCEVLVHGTVELMVTEYCAVGCLLGGRDINNKCTGQCLKGGYALKDRKGYIFPVEMDQYCRMHVFNSRTLCMIKDLNLLLGAGIAAVRIDARREGPGFVSEVVGDYRTVLDILHRKNEDKSKLLNIFSKYEDSNYTKGHYYRGVL